MQTQETIRKWHAPHKVLFSDCKDKGDVQKIIHYARSNLTPTLAQSV